MCINRLSCSSYTLQETVKRRIDLLEAEGISFVTNSDVGVDIDAQRIRTDYDAVVLGKCAMFITYFFVICIYIYVYIQLVYKYIYI